MRPCYFPAISYIPPSTVLLNDVSGTQGDLDQLLGGSSYPPTSSINHTPLSPSLLNPFSASIWDSLIPWSFDDFMLSSMPFVENREDIIYQPGSGEKSLPAVRNRYALSI